MAALAGTRRCPQHFRVVRRLLLRPWHRQRSRVPRRAVATSAGTRARGHRARRSAPCHPPARWWAARSAAHHRPGRALGRGLRCQRCAGRRCGAALSRANAPKCLPYGTTSAPSGNTSRRMSSVRPYRPSTSGAAAPVGPTALDRLRALTDSSGAPQPGEVVEGSPARCSAADPRRASRLGLPLVGPTRGRRADIALDDR